MARHLSERGNRIHVVVEARQALRVERGAHRCLGRRNHHGPSGRVRHARRVARERLEVVALARDRERDEQRVRAVIRGDRVEHFSEDRAVPEQRAGHVHRIARVGEAGQQRGECARVAGASSAIGWRSRSAVSAASTHSAPLFESTASRPARTSRPER